jgi:NhaP-type Na+/H+ or K+/H+ antiporter/mannitol/fructose-specific phosphotransferase system IIA component (Ntr-type)
MHTNELLTTFATAAAAGVCLFSLANYLRISAIVVLLIGGVVVGPECLSLVNPKALGDGLGTIISLSVAIILFEGGLTLDLKGYRTVSKEIWRILTIGVFVTWLGTTVLLWLLFDFELAFCALAASLIIVTGPTVIGPLLHRIRVKPKLHHILHWEGVLIDPVGVFIALLSFEFYASVGGGHQLVLVDFLKRFATGVALGFVFGILLDFVLRREWIRKNHTNIFVLAMAMLNFCIADQVISESGLLSVTIAGLVLGSRTTPQLRSIIQYKVELKDFLIGLLFVLLAANLDLGSFFEFGWQLAAAVVVIMLVIRPINIFASMRTSPLTLNEKAFLSWIAPRGIVAASMASVFTLELKHEQIPNAIFLESFTYSVIVGTVIIQGFTAGTVGRWLGVVQPAPTGWIVVGAHSIGRQTAKFLAKHGATVVIVDTNARAIKLARREGLTALTEDAMLLDPDEHVELYGCGNLLALTSNVELNQMLTRRWSDMIEGSLYRWEKSSSDLDENLHLHAGQKIWQTLQLNRWIHAESDSYEVSIQQADEGTPPDPDTVLLTFDGKAVVPGAPQETSSGHQEWLVFHTTFHDSLGDALPISTANVTFSSQTDLKALYHEMLETLQRQNPILDSDALFGEMWEREQEYTSLVGHGIAIPHVQVTGIADSMLKVVRLQETTTCPLTDNPVEIVFMLLSPAGNPDKHLHHLSSIAHVVSTQKQRDSLLTATSEAELFHVIKSCQTL